MPRKCVAADCNTVSGMGYSLHGWPCDEGVRSKWTRAVKRQRKDWDGPTPTSLLCSNHFEPECFAIEGSRYREEMGLPIKKRLKPDAVPTIFPRPVHGSFCYSSTPPPRPAAEKRQRKAVSK